MVKNNKRKVHAVSRGSRALNHRSSIKWVLSSNVPLLLMTLPGIACFTDIGDAVYSNPFSVGYTAQSGKHFTYSDGETNLI